MNILITIDLEASIRSATLIRFDNVRSGLESASERGQNERENELSRPGTTRWATRARESESQAREKLPAVCKKTDTKPDSVERYWFGDFRQLVSFIEFGGFAP